MSPHGFTAPGRVRVPVLLRSDEERIIITAAAKRAGTSRSEYMRRATLFAAHDLPPKGDQGIAIAAMRDLLRRIRNCIVAHGHEGCADILDDLDHAIDAVSDSVRMMTGEIE